MSEAYEATTRAHWARVMAAVTRGYGVPANIEHQSMPSNPGTEIVAGGHNFLVAPNLGQTAIATTGPVVLRSDADGIPVSADTSRAQVFDICAAIS